MIRKLGHRSSGGQKSPWWGLEESPERWEQFQAIWLNFCVKLWQFCTGQGWGQLTHLPHGNATPCIGYKCIRVNTNNLWLAASISHWYLSILVVTRSSSDCRQSLWVLRSAMQRSFWRSSHFKSASSSRRLWFSRASSSSLRSVAVTAGQSVMLSTDRTFSAILHFRKYWLQPGRFSLNFALAFPVWLNMVSRSSEYWERDDWSYWAFAVSETLITMQYDTKHLKSE